MNNLVYCTIDDVFKAENVDQARLQATCRKNVHPRLRGEGSNPNVLLTVVGGTEPKVHVKPVQKQDIRPRSISVLRKQTPTRSSVDILNATPNKVLCDGEPKKINKGSIRSQEELERIAREKKRKGKRNTKSRWDTKKAYVAISSSQKRGRPERHLQSKSEIERQKNKRLRNMEERKTLEKRKEKQDMGSQCDPKNDDVAKLISEEKETEEGRFQQSRVNKNLVCIKTFNKTPQLNKSIATRKLPPIDSSITVSGDRGPTNINKSSKPPPQELQGVATSGEYWRKFTTPEDNSMNKLNATPNLAPIYSNITVSGDGKPINTNELSMPPPQQFQGVVTSGEYWHKFTTPEGYFTPGPIATPNLGPVYSRCSTVRDDGRPIKINKFSILTPEELQRVTTSGDYWHKFTIVRGAGYSKLEIMQALFRGVRPQMIVPVLYRREGKHAIFMARHCFPALLQLTKDICKYLEIYIQIFGTMGMTTHTLDMEVTLRHILVQDMRINMHDKLAACIMRRYDKTSQLLDLSAFHLDQELSEVVFWPLWTPEGFMYVMNVLKNRGMKKIRHLCLSGNGISELPRLEDFPKLEIVDLSSNMIGDLSILRAFQGLNIVDIMLDVNPVCAVFIDEISYLRAVQEYLPSVKRIDGVYLFRPDVPAWRRHYVPPDQTECVALVDQFLQHYFTLLDGDDRQRLRGMYHPDAMFSLTCNYVPGQSTSNSARLTRYTLESRNLLNLSDHSKRQQLLSYRAEDVLATLCRLPRTEHDPYSFTVDLPYYTQDAAVIVVSGVFREPSMMKEHLIRAFSRTFVLRKVASKEYQIVNEMLTVSNASTKQAEESFLYPKPKISLAKLSFYPAQDLTDADRRQMTKLLSRLTQLNPEWSEKCLKQSKWDIKLALGVFTELLKTNKLPGEAFGREENVGEKQ